MGLLDQVIGQVIGDLAARAGAGAAPAGRAPAPAPTPASPGDAGAMVSRFSPLVLALLALLASKQLKSGAGGYGSVLRDIFGKAMGGGAMPGGGMGDGRRGPPGGASEDETGYGPGDDPGPEEDGPPEEEERPDDRYGRGRGGGGYGRGGSDRGGYQPDPYDRGGYGRGSRDGGSDGGFLDEVGSMLDGPGGRAAGPGGPSAGTGRPSPRGGSGARTAGPADLPGISSGGLGDLLGGGLGGLLERFARNGQGGLMRSWVDQGPNAAASPAELEQALGTSTVAELASRTGLGRDDLLAQLSQALPEIVDQLTPHGRLPTEAEHGNWV